MDIIALGQLVQIVRMVKTVVLIGQVVKLVIAQEKKINMEILVNG